MAITASGHQLFDSLHGLLTCALLPDCFSRNNGNRYEACFSQHELRSSRHDGCVATVSHRQPPMRGSTSGCWCSDGFMSTYRTMSRRPLAASGGLQTLQPPSDTPGDVPATICHRLRGTRQIQAARLSTLMLLFLWTYASRCSCRWATSSLATKDAASPSVSSDLEWQQNTRNQGHAASGQNIDVKAMVCVDAAAAPDLSVATADPGLRLFVYPFLMSTVTQCTKTY